jgi:hypothetical protein
MIVVMDDDRVSGEVLREIFEKLFPDRLMPFVEQILWMELATQVNFVINLVEMSKNRHQVVIQVPKDPMQNHQRKK